MSVKLGGGGAAAAGLTAESVLPAGYARAVEDFKALQGELQAAVGKQTTLEAQRNENHLVKEVRETRALARAHMRSNRALPPPLPFCAPRTRRSSTR